MRKVIQNDNKIYPSIKNASDETGIDQSNITKACGGAYAQTGGSTWQYVD